MKHTLRPFRLTVVILIAALFSSCRSTTSTETATYDLLLRQATVIDGTGSPAYTANILVSGDSIALIDRDTTHTYTAAETIEARGLVLSPGFIDTHAHGDPLATPAFENFIAQGVTTISLGQDGFSPEHTDLRPWMDSVSMVKPAVNVALFAGHGTLRLLSGIGYDSIPTNEHLQKMQQLLRDALAAGCFGMTTGLEYTPGYFADVSELNSMAQVLGEQNAILMSHMRNEDDAFVEASIRELLAQGQYCPVHVSHLKVVYGKGQQRAQQVLSLLDSARTAGIRVTADVYPYTASYTGIAIVFPEWAQKPYNYADVKRTRRKELLSYLRDRVNKRNGPEATLIGSGKYTGKTLAQIATELQKPFEEVLVDDIGPYGASGAYFVMNDALQEALIQAPHVMVCTDGSPTMHHPRGYGSFPKVIEKYARKQNLFTLEEAIYKMTGLPAITLGLKDRGMVKEGYKADLLLFDPAQVRETATYEQPQQLAQGFRYVLVNGKIAKHGEQQLQRHGRMLRKGQN